MSFNDAVPVSYALTIASKFSFMHIYIYMYVKSVSLALMAGYQIFSNCHDFYMYYSYLTL